ncbi:alpha-N-acetylglucosaminidase [Vallitalea okinawensis]|uniref:alpha-N-acetylglucosaminidase n=1 Tax=Vallitalea okinawensis TaxID=2078660 RepID=UPI000CFB481A|nr:alpha-N-acetylglucosaminidase [Vallitalea okinawensis]
MKKNLLEHEKSGYELIKRILPDDYQNFKIEIIGNTEHDVFEIVTVNEKILLRGNNAVSIGSALHWYLKFYCNCHISWCGNRLELPKPLPLPSTKIRKQTPNKYRYYLNYCTFNYSMAWWDWDRWEKEIDWMALNGINMPLSIIGHEYLWIKVGQKLGISKEKMKEFLTGPAFFAWNFMGNVDGIGGPLPDSWIEEHYELQKKILKRQRELGMMPVLPGFYGHIPQALGDKHPSAMITQLESWYGVAGVYFLDPQDKLFDEIADIFYSEQKKLYGSDHLYSMDLFHEGSSPNASEEYMQEAALNVYKKMIDHDKEGVWVMQSWSMQECMVKVLPSQHLMLLDLYGEHDPKWEKTEAFYGKPWLWCLLHNFGGINGLTGNLKNVYNELHKAYTSDHNGDMVGVGFAPEAIEENPVFYDLVSQMIWDYDEEINMDEWIKNYLLRRYGKENDKAMKAWEYLLDSVYSGVNSFGCTDSIICARPAFEIEKVVNSKVKPYFDLRTLFNAWEQLINAADHLNGVEPFEYDLTDVGREVLAMYARPIYLQMITAYKNRNKNIFIEHWKVLKELILDLDQLVGTQKLFTTKKWLEDAKSWAHNDDEAKLYEYNARMQITQWWPDVSFHDYAHKHWSGLLKEFYLKRWKIFVNYLHESLTSNQEMDYPQYEQDVLQFENTWIESCEPIKESTHSDTISLSRKLYSKYKSILKNYN